MKLLRPDTKPLSLLFLGGADLPARQLRERFREAGLLTDFAQDRDTAFEVFLDRGGHAAILRLGRPDQEVEAILAALRIIDPALLDWRFASLPCVEELEAFEREVRKLLDDRASGLPRP